MEGVPMSPQAPISKARANSSPLMKQRHTIRPGTAPPSPTVQRGREFENFVQFSSEGIETRDHEGGNIQGDVEHRKGGAEKCGVTGVKRPPFGTGTRRTSLWDVAAGSRLLQGSSAGVPVCVDRVEMNARVDAVRSERLWREREREREQKEEAIRKSKTGNDEVEGLGWGEGRESRGYQEEGKGAGKKDRRVKKDDKIPNEVFVAALR